MNFVLERLQIALRIFPNMGEVVVAMNGPLELLKAFVLGGPVIVLVFYAGWHLFMWPYVRVERIRELLRCEKSQAKEVLSYLDEIGVEWMKFYTWMCACEGQLMPTFAFRNRKRGNDQFIATWQESRKAMLKLSLERRLDPKWSKDDALGAVVSEIMKERVKAGGDIFNPGDED